jgi:DNA-binding CsgD family transcriptional regulator
MSRNKLIETLRLNLEAIRQSGQKGLPMGLRLFLFLILFLTSIVLGILLILFATGVFKASLHKHKPVIQSELAHIVENIDKSFGNLSVQTVELAKELSLSIERNLKEHRVPITDLQDHPDLLEYLLEEELSRLTGALEKSRASGVFLLLDATVNPKLLGAENSRACLYLKNMEPNIVNGMAANLRFGSGPMTIARNNGIHVLPQWQMEMDISKFSYFTEVMAVAREQKLPPSRLYRWIQGTALPGYSERIMLCIMPLIASDGTVFAACGFEVSEMLFKLTYAPKSEIYDYLICMLSPLNGDMLQLSGALFAGSFAAGSIKPDHTDIEISLGRGGFYTYRQPDKDKYAGLHQIISLYPTDSAYADEQWAVVLMMPHQGLNRLASTVNRNLIMGLLVLIFVNIGLALFISHTYINPVEAALEYLKTASSPATIKTRIPEIDDLIEFLAAQDDSPVPIENKKLPAQEYSNLCQEFINNISTLSPAEKLVFDLYVQGHTAKEIAEILCLSINTIKTHNRRIYMKLNVTSRKELMLYIQMIEEANIPII